MCSEEDILALMIIAEVCCEDEPEISPFITKLNTLMRVAISAEVRLNITLRFLTDINRQLLMKYLHSVPYTRKCATRIKYTPLQN
nr:unnamed protein product [Callosobruchus chinensis]